MPSARFVGELNAQIGNELAASQQYLAIAVFYDERTLPRLAGFFYRQSLEERDHALMMVRYLMDVGESPAIPGLPPPRADFADETGPIELALDQEREVSEQIAHLTTVAREDNDFASEQFMQWFIKEQVEEVASMSALLAVARRAQAVPFQIEEYLARETGDGGRDASAPPVAGGG